MVRHYLLRSCTRPLSWTLSGRFISKSCLSNFCVLTPMPYLPIERSNVAMLYLQLKTEREIIRNPCVFPSRKSTSQGEHETFCQSSGIYDLSNNPDDVVIYRSWLSTPYTSYFDYPYYTTFFQVSQDAKCQEFNPIVWKSYHRYTIFGLI